MFWTFNQNNSGGSFEFLPNDGLTHFVIIEATSQLHCMQRALDLGIYFNGCDEGRDCSCCGDRWYEPDEEGDDTPLIYGEPPAEYDGSQWMEDGKEICVHYIDGRKEWFGVKTAANPSLQMRFHGRTLRAD